MKSIHLLGIAAVVFALAGVFLTGCGSKEDAPTTTPSPNAAASAATTTAQPEVQQQSTGKPATK